MSLNILLKGQLRYLDQHFDVTAISGPGPDLDEVRTREGVKTHTLEMQRQISPIKDLISIIQLYHYFRKEKPDIVHSITPKAGLLSMVAGKLAGVPIRMHTFTGLVFPYRKGLMQQLLIMMDKILCSCATNIYPEGEGVKSDLQNYKITNKTLKIIANGNLNGIDLDHFNPQKFTVSDNQIFRAGLGLRNTDVIFLFVGRLVKDKGINELIDAFREVNFKFPDAKLLLVGPFEQGLDPLRADVISEIEQNKNIITVGFQKDVRPYFAIADAFVFPSHREGFPNVVLQAGAMGLYSIVTNISGSNEIIKNEINGRIISVNDKKEISLAMEGFLENKESISIMKNECRSAIARYDQVFVWECTKNEYVNNVAIK